MGCFLSTLLPTRHTLLLAGADVAWWLALRLGSWLTLAVGSTRRHARWPWGNTGREHGHLLSVLLSWRCWASCRLITVVCCPSVSWRAQQESCSRDGGRVWSRGSG